MSSGVPANVTITPDQPVTVNPNTAVSADVVKPEFPLSYVKAQPVKEVDAYYRNPLKFSHYTVHAANEGIVKRFCRRALKVGVVVGAVSGWWMYRLVTSEEGEMVSTPSQRYLLRSLPSRKLSRWFGAVAELNVPPFIIQSYAYTTSADITEASPPSFEAYPTLQAFFTRPIDPATRPISTSPLVSPCDGTVLRTGQVTNENLTAWIDQIKGYRYELEDLIRYRPSAPREGKKRVFCVIWLSPGDYHRFHVPAEGWAIKCLNHVYGTLLPTHPLAYKFVDELPCLNERVALNGTWEHGLLSVTPVGAYNVGSIKLAFDKGFASNRTVDDEAAVTSINSRQHRVTKYLDPVKPGGKGDVLGHFEMGSTVVIVADIPQDAELCVGTSDKVKMGEALMSCKSG
eukprot:TRINITY_DN23456_c1_g1_i1.p1 TRINITY_DN23456_c1_g1~~TRINITY_DN23456_c1_g1_i1.p1  ORF type:complete len:415 (+),score=66.34 TRINITY_DN23456_c1_g1_i1:47-1246(+)